MKDGVYKDVREKYNESKNERKLEKKVRATYIFCYRNKMFKRASTKKIK